MPRDQFGAGTSAPPKKKKKKEVVKTPRPAARRAPQFKPEHFTPASAARPTPQKPVAPKTPTELLAVAKPQEQSSQEQSLADIVQPYYAQQKAFPDPITALQLLLNKGIMPQDPEEQKNMYDELWSPASDATDAEQPALRAGDMFYIDKGELTDGVVRGEAQVDGTAMGGLHTRPMSDVQQEARRARELDPEQPSMGDIQLAKQYQRDIKDPWNITGADFVGAITPAEEIIKLKHELANRLKERGMPIRYDPNSSKWDPEWEKVQNKYIFAGQWAYQVYGDYSQTAQANDVMASVRSIAFGKDRVEQAAKRLGLDVTTWSQSDTVKSTLEAMRYSDDDTVKAFSYDEFQFARPIGMSVEERRGQYAREFSVDRLPSAPRALYEAEYNTGMELLGKAFGKVLIPGKKLLDVPGIGPALRHVGAAMAGSGGYIYTPLNDAMKAATKMSIKEQVMFGLSEPQKNLSAGKVMFDRSTTGLWRSEMVKLERESGGKARTDPGDHGDPDLGVLVDMAAWDRAREEAGGDNAFHIAFEGTEYGANGKMASWTVNAADGANLALQWAVGNKFDPLWVAAAEKTLHGAFVATRAGYKFGSSFSLDLGAIRAGMEMSPGTKAFSFGFDFGTKAERLARYDAALASRAAREERATAAGARAVDRDGNIIKPKPAPRNYHGSSRGEITEIDPNATSTSLGGFDTTASSDAATVYSQSKRAGATPHVTEFEGVPKKAFDLDAPASPEVWRAVAAGAGKKKKYIMDVSGTNKQALAHAVQQLGPDGLKKIRKVIEDKFGHDAYTYMEDMNWPGGVGQHQVTSWTKGAIEKGTVKPVRPKGLFPGATDAGEGHIWLSHPSAPGKKVLVSGAKGADGKPRIQPLDNDEFHALHPSYKPPRKTAPPETPENFMDNFLTSRDVPNETGKPLTSGYLDEDVRLSMKADGAKVEVKNLEVPPTRRTEGLGGGIVDDLTSAADDAGITLRLKAVPFDDTITKEALKDLYARRGFREVDGDWMERKPLDVGRVEGDIDAYNSYFNDANEMLHAHISDPLSPILAHGVAGETVSMHSLGGGLVESVTRTAKGIIKRRDIHTYTTPAMLRNNAELFAKIPRASVINRLLRAPEDVLEVQTLVKQVAKSESHVEVEGLLRKLEALGVDIDGGKSALIKQIRYSLGEKGFGQLGASRIFNTMTMYGKSSDMASASEDAFNVGKAIRMGATTKAGRKEALTQLQDIVERVYMAPPAGKQQIIKEMWKTFEKNLGEEKLIEFKAYNRRVQWMRGQRYVEEVLGHSYLPKYVIDQKTGARKLVEGSAVLPSDLEGMLSNVEQGALRQWDELWAGKETQLADEVDQLERGYHAAHVAKPGDPVPTTGKSSAWKNNTRTHSRSDGTGYTETRKYNPKTKKYDITGRTQTKFAHTGVKTSRGKKGGAALTNKRRELARLNKQREQLIKNPAIAQARIDMAKLATELGASPADIAKMSDAVFDATARATRRTENARIVQELSPKKRLTPAEERKYDQAVNELGDMRAAQPFKQGQLRTHIYHDYDPRIAGWFMSGKPVANFMLADQAVFEPVMRLFKETVMASMAFPIRVNIGDELVRLIPEGVAGRMRSVYKMKKELKLDGTEFTEFELKLRDGLASDWDTSNVSGSWEAITPGEPGYYPALREDLKSWAREPIVKRLIASKNWGGVGKFPTNPKDLKGFIRRIRDERTKNPETGKMEYTQDAVDMRTFLDDTYRSIKGKGEGPGTYNTPAFEEWCDNWYDRMKFFSDHEPMRKAMEGKTPTATELERWGSVLGKDAEGTTIARNVLYPVNTPVRNGLMEGVRTGIRGMPARAKVNLSAEGRKSLVARAKASLKEGAGVGLRNPLYGASAFNPYHYAFKYGSSKLMQGIGNWTKKQLFNDRYYTVRNKLLERNAAARAAGEIEIPPEEVHRLAGEAGAKYAHQAAYSSSTTMFEDMSRNMIPFISAYRQFFVYWAGAVAKHPISLGLYYKNYPEFLQDPFYFSSGDSQFITPAIPFWTPDAETGKGFWDQVSAQSPSAGLIPLMGMRPLIGALGEDPEDYATRPLLKGLGGTMAPFQRLAKLTYGLTGDTWMGDISESLFGDPQKLETLHANSIMYWTKYDVGGTGTEGINLDNAPPGVKALWALTGGKGGWGEEHLRPEALYNEMTKTFAPTPFGIIYSPKPQRDMQSAYFEYQTALKAGDEKGMNLVRTKYPDFDLDLRYHDASNAEQIAMKMDPKNFRMLKWWQTPYNYDNADMQMNPADWQESFFNNGGVRLSDAARLAAYHNVVTDIYGGHYVQGAKRDSGVPYMGDIKLVALQKGAEKLIQQRLDWAEGVATQISKSLKWDKSDLLYRFQHPGGIDEKTGKRSGWGMWNDIIKSKGLSYDEYDINFIHQAAMAEGEARLIPYTVPDEDLARAYQLRGMMADPKLGNRLISETPESQNIRATLAESRKGVLDATIALASDQWYYITAEQLQIVTGGKVDPKINLAQQTLKTAYTDWHKSTAGTQEYKDGHNAYYALQHKLLGGLAGGKALIGGLDDRLEHIDYFTKPVVTSIGGGASADKQLAAWDDYVKVRDQQLKSASPNPDAIESAWDKFTAHAGAKGQENKELEIGRVRMWHRVLEMAHVARKQLKNSYSDYYEAKGNSAYSKDGIRAASQLNTTINQMADVNPRFKNDIKEYFSNSNNVGGKLIDWYNY